MKSGSKVDETDEQALLAQVGALLVFEGIWHLRALSGQELKIKLVT